MFRAPGDLAGPRRRWPAVKKNSYCGPRGLRNLLISAIGSRFPVSSHFEVFCAPFGPGKVRNLLKAPPRRVFCYKTPRKVHVRTLLICFLSHSVVPRFAWDCTFSVSAPHTRHWVSVATQLWDLITFQNMSNKNSAPYILRHFQR